jgi:hypothetical protein
MGVEKVARTMAHRALSDAIADVDAQRARQAAISRGLIGAVLNALEKGVPEGEVAETLRSHGGAEALRAALAVSAGVITEQQREVLVRLVQQEPESGHIASEPCSSVAVGSIAAWGPLSAEALREVLLLAADVADTDQDHDLASALDVLNKDVFGPAKREQLHPVEQRQVAQALLALVPAIEFDRSQGSELAAVDAWVTEHMGDRGGGEPAVSGLAELLRRAAAALLETSASSASREGGGERA